ncbi:hypothetical protein [Nocardia wallacei]|uniref:hypothetical protein n=1 Tax=Nocardia wallacei TaxID=480035 RepID=UPI0024560F20|nr:hypothetical protein [Nocardia wallacei]
MNSHSVVRRRITSICTAFAAAGAAVAVMAAPASAGNPGECLSPAFGVLACGIIHNSGAMPIGIFNNWDRPVPGRPDTDNWNQYAQSHPQTASAIWDYWSDPENESEPDHKDGMTAALLPPGAASQSLGPKFQDSDGFYIGEGMRALVDIGPSHFCLIGPIYYQIHNDWPRVDVAAGPSIC